MLYDIALLLVLLGALNWGLIALSDFNIIDYLNKSLHSEMFPKIMYSIIGISALIIIIEKTYRFVFKKTLYFKNYEFHWCNDGLEGDIKCRRAGYGNKCLNNTCIEDTSL